MDNKKKYTRNVVRATQRTDAFLNAAVDDHKRRLLASIKELENNIIDLTTDFKTTDGVLLGPKANMKMARSFHKKLLAEFDATYGSEARKITRGYSKAATFIKRNFKELDEVVKFTSVDKTMMQALQTASFNNFASFGTATQSKLMDAIYRSVIGRQKYSSFVNEIQGLLSGYKDVKGRPMSKYAELYANDGIMNFHNEIQLKKSKDLGINNFLYYGNIMGTTRPFCRERAGKTYSREEIDSWTFPWNGKAGPAMTSRGGYNCRHHWQPVRVKKIDAEYLDDQIKPPTPVVPAAKKPKKAAKKTKKVVVPTETSKLGSRTVIPKKNISSSSNLGGGVNESKLVKLKDGRKGVFKPEAGEDWLVRDTIDGFSSSLAKREVMAYHVDRALGINMVPKTTYVKIGKDTGSFQLFIDSSVSETLWEGADMAVLERYKMTVFDYVIGNTDRHKGNYMRMMKKTGALKKGNTVAIDHGYSFPFPQDRDWGGSARAGTNEFNSEPSLGFFWNKIAKKARVNWLDNVINPKFKAKLVKKLDDTDWRSMGKAFGLNEGEIGALELRAKRMSKLIEKDEVHKWRKDYNGDASDAWWELNYSL